MLRATALCLAVPIAASAQGNQWRVVTGGESSEDPEDTLSFVFVETASMQKDRAWVYSVSKKVAVEFLEEVDCTKSRHRLLAFRHTDLSGKVTSADATADWTSDAPGTPLAAVGEYVCSGGAKKGDLDMELPPGTDPVAFGRDLINKVQLSG